MNAEGIEKRGQRLAVLAAVGLVVVVLSGLAVDILGDPAVGALLGVIVVIAALGLRQQSRYARRSAASAAASAAASVAAFAAVSRALDATDRRVAAMATEVAAQSETTLPDLSKEVTRLSKLVAQWSKDAREAEIETGIAALNRYVALGSDDAAHQA